MPSSTSWKRYDEEHNVSAIFTEAARACVVENPRNVTDYLVRYFAKVAGGISIKQFRGRNVVGSNAGPALTFTLELCTGPEVSITTSDATLVVAPGLESADSVKGGDDSNEKADLHEQYDQIFCTVQSSLIPQLCRLGSVEPQSEWDNVLANVWSESTTFTPSIQWAVSMLASLAAAKQRRVPLFQYLGGLIDPHTTGNVDDESYMQSNKQSVVAPAVGHPPTDDEKGQAAAGRHYAPPRLLVPFLVNDRNSRGPDAAPVPGQVQFAKVYVGLDPLTSLDEDGAVEGEEIHNSSNCHNNTKDLAEEGKTLRRRIHALHRAARLFLAANPTARVGSGGCLYWTGATNLTEVVKVVTDVLEAVQLRPGVDVCIGLSLGGNKVRVRNNGAGDGGANGSASPTTTTTMSSKAAAAAAAAAAADPSGLYEFFCGDPFITGEQLTEYLKEQLEEIGTGVVQFMEDTHSMDDTVARQRLQVALQDSIVLSGNSAFDSDSGMDRDTTGPAYAAKRTAEAVVGTYPTTVVDLSRCESVQAAAQLLRTAADAGNSAVTALVGHAAGCAEAAAHVVDLAVAGKASYLMTSSGPLSAVTMAVVSRLAEIMTELVEMQAAAPRLPFKRFNRYDLPPLPALDVAPIKHKGDKKKKDTRKGNAKRK